MDKSREPTKAERERDLKFLSHIFFEVRDYAISAGQNPDETLRAVAEWIMVMLKVGTFNGGAKDE